MGVWRGAGCRVSEEDEAVGKERDLTKKKGMQSAHIPYSRYFWGGKIFVSSEFLASSWKIFCDCGILCVQMANYAALFHV